MKKGSALLLVLGMLSFMVISAVAFSAFMRYSRLPSSYLRRSSSSRLLVKAALARAIDIVDAAIADNPHPGIGKKTILYSEEYDGFRGGVVSAGEELVRNKWRNHVFIGTNYLVSAAETVSTLTLEGLAYLPPALINEARYYSRHSTSARWQTFGYDSGRFAFCAVDVSDHLNVNKVAADIGRGSSPGNRFSLAYVFENADHTDYTVEPEKWDEFMRNYVDIDATREVLTPWDTSSGSASASKLPLVSVADLNLAINRNGQAFKDYFPFVSYIKGGADDYASTSPTVAEMQRHMAFVTDGYFPSSGGSGEKKPPFDLSYKESQPFQKTQLESKSLKQIGDFFDGSVQSTGADQLKGKISCLGLAMLWDYLDVNNVPVSLAMPSVERIPMICGIKVSGNKMTLLVENAVTDPGGGKIENLVDDILKNDYPGADNKAPPSESNPARNARYVKKYFLSGKFANSVEDINIKAVVTYPFRRGRDLVKSDSFTIDGHAELFLTTGDMKFRTGTSADSLHMKDDAAFGEAPAYNGNGVFHFPLAAPSFPTKLLDPVKSGEDAAVEEVDWQLGTSTGMDALRNAIANNSIFEVVMVQKQEARNNGTTESPNWVWGNVGVPDTDGAKCGIPLLTENGVVDSNFSSDSAVKAYLKGTDALPATLRMAVWLRVKNGDGKTVDLVPACLNDDKFINGVDNVDSPCEKACGPAYPVMRFTCSEPFAFKDSGDDGFDKNGNDHGKEILPKGLLCGDPRWNWAPEQWFVDDNASKQQWLDKCGKGLAGRDPDIFMATSDAAYLQSVYELAFLPRLSNSGFGGHDDYGDLEQPADGRAEWAESLDGAGQAGCRNVGLMWRTYRPFAYDTADKYYRDDFENVGFVSDGGGMKLNPYSDNENILVAAFANTPESWWAASANTDESTGHIPKEERIADAPSFNENYAWCESSSGAKFAWKDLVQVVSAFKEDMQEQETMDGWEDAYDDMWVEEDYSNRKRLMGVDLNNGTTDIFGVDRKFLYGYWRDCFALKQQLFLIFVRAEPMMMGGGAIGQTPPQLGARAVALVWRDPKRPENAVSSSSCGPHQTKVLFYRQFD